MDTGKLSLYPSARISVLLMSRLQPIQTDVPSMLAIDNGGERVPTLAEHPAPNAGLFRGPLRPLQMPGHVSHAKFWQRPKHSAEPPSAFPTFSPVARENSLRLDLFPSRRIVFIRAVKPLHIRIPHHGAPPGSLAPLYKLALFPSSRVASLVALLPSLDTRLPAVLDSYYYGPPDTPRLIPAPVFPTAPVVTHPDTPVGFYRVTTMTSPGPDGWPSYSPKPIPACLSRVDRFPSKRINFLRAVESLPKIWTRIPANHRGSGVWELPSPVLSVRDPIMCFADSAEETEPPHSAQWPESDAESDDEEEPSYAAEQLPEPTCSGGPSCMRENGFVVPHLAEVERDVQAWSRAGTQCDAPAPAVAVASDPKRTLQAGVLRRRVSTRVNSLIKRGGFR